MTTRDGLLTTILARLLDVPAPLHRLMLRTFTGGTVLSEVVRSDEALAEFVRANVFGVWHASGTCQMGSPADPLAVVDPRGWVIGVDGLTIADASVMPRLPSANTNVPTIMVAEKIAQGLAASR